MQKDPPDQTITYPVEYETNSLPEFLFEAFVALGNCSLPAILMDGAIYFHWARESDKPAEMVIVAYVLSVLITHWSIAWNVFAIFQITFQTEKTTIERRELMRRNVKTAEKAVRYVAIFTLPFLVFWLFAASQTSVGFKR